MLQFKVNEELCTFCKECIEDCPSGIIEAGDSVPVIHESSESKCIRCQHCLAVCPEGAISILGKKPEDSLSLNLIPEPLSLEALLRGRRTVRRFTEEPVPAEVTRKLIQAAANAPTGKNTRKVNLILFDDPSESQKAKEIIISETEKLSGIPEPSRKEKAYLTMAKLYRRGNDIIFRGAPHLVLASVPTDVTTPEADALIALTYMELMAASMNLGTVWAGFISHLLNDLPDLQKKLGVPDGQKFVFGLLYGNPAVKYARGVQRDEIEIIRPLL